MTNEPYRCVDCGAVIPERDDGFLNCKCPECDALGMVNEPDYIEYFQKPVSPPPRPHAGRIETYPVDSGEKFKFVGELSGEWVRSDTAVNLGDCA